MRLFLVGAARALRFGNSLLTFGNPAGSICTEGLDPILTEAGDFIITE
jgi:hypothetical protein